MPKICKKQALFGVIGGIFFVYRKKAYFGPTLGLFEAIFGLPVVARGPMGQLWCRKWESYTESETYLAQFRFF